MNRKESIRILIADDHSLYCEGFTGLFKKTPNMKVVGQASNGQELIELAATMQPDVIFTDIKMPVMDGIKATAEIVKNDPDVKVVALSMFNDDDLVVDMMEAGAKGYLLKNSHRTDIMNAIEAVMNEETYYCKETSEKLTRLLAKSDARTLRPVKKAIFTAKEKEVIQLICEGRSNKEMSDILFLSVRTIEGYRNRINEKMMVHNTAGIVVYAIREGLYEV